MKRCVVCEAEIKTDLEEYGDPREPVCMSCWLEGYLQEPPELKDQKKVELRKMQGSLYG
jgi:hypothetical protein